MPGKLVFILEDNTDLAIGLETILETYGYAVKRTADGSIALNFCTQQMPDLMIVDIVLQKMDGITFLKNFYKFPGGENIPVIVITGMADRFSGDDLKDLGVGKILLKPFDLDSFMAAVRDSLKE